MLRSGFILLFVALRLHGADPKAELNLAAGWRAELYGFSKEKLQHPAWGIAHCERDYLLAVRLAREEELKIDEEVLFAAALLHDMGAFEPFRAPDTDHTDRGAQTAVEILAKVGFPSEKIPKVQEAIRAHMFYSKKPEGAEAIVLHDADTLDFLGAIGITRILSLTGHHRWAPDLKGGVDTIEKFETDLPDKLLTKAAKTMGKSRVAEMKRFREALNDQTGNKKSL